MYLIIKLLIITGVINICICNILCQIPISVPNSVNMTEPGKERTHEQYLKNRELVLQAMSGSKGYEPRFNPTYRIRESEKIRMAGKMESKMLGEDFNRLAVPNEYLIKFSQILRNKKNGLTRLYPEKNCFVGKTVSVEDAERCEGILPILGGGSYYSFRLKTHMNETKRIHELTFLKGEFSDIHFVDGYFWSVVKQFRG